jgi:hypothetical protein
MVTVLAQVRTAKQKIEAAHVLAGSNKDSFSAALAVIERVEVSLTESARLVGAACLAVVDLRKQFPTDAKVKHRLDAAFARLSEGEQTLGNAENGAI